MTQDAQSQESIEALKELAKTLSVAIEALSTHDLPVLNEPIDFYEQVRRFEIRLIEHALRRTGGNQTQAARLLSLNQPTLHGKLKQYHICPDTLVSRDRSRNGDSKP